MKKMLMIVLVAMGLSSLAAVSVPQVIVRQQWPWSSEVKVEYIVSGVTTPVDMTLEAYNGDVKLDSDKVFSNLKGDVYGITSDGPHSFTFSPDNAFGGASGTIMNLKIRLTASESTTAEVLYKVFDLETGTVTDVRKSDFLNGTYSCLRDYSEFSNHPLAIENAVTFSTDLKDVFIWTDLTNDVAYSTTKLVLRRIPAKNVEWSQGAASTDLSFQAGETAHPVKLTQDYYIGVFEMTKKQCELVTGASCAGNGDDCPVVSSGFATIRDAETWPNVTDPTTAHNVGTTTIMGKLRAKFNNAYAFDLPTEAQWEFACRAGTTGSMYTSPNNTPGMNGTQKKHANVVCWHKDNCADRKAQPVGRLLPNAFGLYDMYGNVGEYCLDRYATYEDNGYTTGSLVENPVGALTGESRVLRVNMSAGKEYKQARSASRSDGTGHLGSLTGFRVCMPAVE